jgi:lysozyme family protein
MDIEKEDAARLQAIADAPDWATTRALMNARDAWWKQHRRWDNEAQEWLAI